MKKQLQGSGALAMLVLLLSLASPAHIVGQLPSVQAWVGTTQDLKPNPFSGSTEVQSASTVGATVLVGRTFGQPWGVSVSRSRFSEDLHHIDLVLLLRFLKVPAFLDIHGGLSRAVRQGQVDGTSIDWLLGPAMGVVLGDRLAIELAGVTQFRWSPENNDYLRLGLRLGLVVGFGK